jgi:murein DD-endopeptidase MepM/ murein hydrolase activator NlpD
MIEHAFGWTTVYGHCSKVAVSVGDRVKRGEVVGFIGSTGKSTGPHVHYEVRIGGKTVNPYYYLGGSR